MNKNELSAGTKNEQRTAADSIPSASLEQNGLLGDVFVFELVGERLNQISVAFKRVEDANSFIKTMKDGYKYKQSVLVAAVILNIA